MDPFRSCAHFGFCHRRLLGTCHAKGSRGDEHQGRGDEMSKQTEEGNSDGNLKATLGVVQDLRCGDPEWDLGNSGVPGLKNAVVRQCFHCCQKATLENVSFDQNLQCTS